jgi:hypothetical protein
MRTDRIAVVERDKEAQITASITQASLRFTTRESAVAGALCDLILSCGSGLPVGGIVHCERNTLPLPESSNHRPVIGMTLVAGGPARDGHVRATRHVVGCGGNGHRRSVRTRT